MAIQYHGTQRELLNRLAQIGPCLAGTMEDRTGAVHDALVAVGMVTLANIHDHFRRLSEGGVGHDGTTWQPLAVTTLALRTKDTTTAAISRLLSELAGTRTYKGVPPWRRRLMARNAQRLKAFYLDNDQKVTRRRAINILNRMKPYISETRYNKTLSEITTLSKQGTPRAARRLRATLYAAASALILRDTGALFNSLEPVIGALGQAFYLGPGYVDVGTEIDYAKYHQSPEQRKLKADGTPILPRRPFIPDQVPQKWIDDAHKALTKVLGSGPWIVKFLGAKAS